jgi:hypothetical protein
MPTLLRGGNIIRLPSRLDGSRILGTSTLLPASRMVELRPGRHVTGRYGVGTLWCVRASDAFIIQFNAISIAKRPLKGGAWIALEEGWKVTPCGRRSNPRDARAPAEMKCRAWEKWRSLPGPATTKSRQGDRHGWLGAYQPVALNENQEFCPRGRDSVGNPQRGQRRKRLGLSIFAFVMAA